MYKKLITILLFILLLNILFSGCLENNVEKKINYISKHNSAPIPAISAPNEGYFGEIIEFDASNSYDLDGDIVQYSWDMGETIGHKVTGELVSHQYNAVDRYTITLTVTDDNGAKASTSLTILGDKLTFELPEIPPIEPPPLP